ncbi:MAG TPA: c-type cytochrome [Kofleriaceae bacterium]|jgi:DNA-binding beta-propeller fold protein YncE/mono/diheme cytochrome c family protein
MRPRNLAALCLVVAAAVPAVSYAKRMVDIDEMDMAVPDFALHGRALGGTKSATGGAAYLAGSRIAVAGNGVLVIDADSGNLMSTTADNKLLAKLSIGREAGLLAYDPVTSRAYVADRRGDRIVVVDTSQETLSVVASWKTPVEPYGVALAPDRKTLLVSTIADRTLVAFDTDKGSEKWRTGLGREPRGIAISPDGTRALVALLATGTVDQIDLTEAHKSEHIALSTTQGKRNEVDAFARASFSVAFLGNGQAVVPFQRETPVQRAGAGERSGSYGGGFDPPITQQLAFVSFSGHGTQQVTASTSGLQSRALTWDATHDSLYVASFANDQIQRIKDASKSTVASDVVINVGGGKTSCGPDGIAVKADGSVMVWCSLNRTVAHVDGKNTAQIDTSAPLVESALTTEQHKGMELFTTSSAAISQRGALACASCHPDNRADGLSWRIDKHVLQTPLLAGRIVGTHPYKWDGGDKDLNASLTSTMKRLGGFGLKKDETGALSAYVESLPAVRTPSRDATAVAHGKTLFDSEGCQSCHAGPSFTDNERHKLTGTLPESDTPSLVGVGASAPYFHDGSAATLEALLRDRGAVHGMADTSKLSDKDVADLTAFLETL